MTILNFNSNPYYDDFDDSKGFHRILFKPGVAVQTRELTQLQTILSDQIAKFGNHIFKQGSIVIPGNSILETVNTVALISPPGGAIFAESTFREGDEIEGALSQVRAIVKKYVRKSDTSALLFVVYTRGGQNGENFFVHNEMCFKVRESGIRFPTPTVGNAFLGEGLIFNLNEGIFYINGKFVKVHGQSIIVSETSPTASAIIGLRIEESTINWTQDDTLLDNSRGATNFGAPGADRLIVKLNLHVQPLNTQMGENFVHLMTVNNGVIEFHSRFPKYSALDNYFARRTFDESGNYVVDGFDTHVIEDLRRTGGSGRSAAGNEAMFNYVVAPGKAYVQGYEVERIAPTMLQVSKAREFVNRENMAVRPSFGTYIYINDVQGLPNLMQHQEIQLFDANISGGSQIGTARAFDIDYQTGSGANTIYRLYVYDVNFSVANSTFASIGRVVYGALRANVVHRYTVERLSGDAFVIGEAISAAGVTGTATVVHVDSPSSIFLRRGGANVMPPFGSILTATGGKSARVTELVSFAQPGTPVLLARIPTETTIRSVRDAQNNMRIRYRIREQFTITTNASGAGSFTLSTGNIEVLESSSFFAFLASGVPVPLNIFSLDANGITVTITGGVASTTYTCYADVARTNIIERTKTLLTQNETLASAAIVNLLHADIYDIISINSSTMGDVRSLFDLDNGQRDTHYQTGRLIARTTQALGTLTISYRYFQHSAGGDFFTVDSYRNSGLGATFRSQIGRYISDTNNVEYYLRDYFDFRKIRTDSARQVANNSSIIFDVQAFLPRIDAVILNKESEILVRQGISALQPRAPSVSENEILLYTATVDAYTANVSRITLNRARNTRFTMSDINQMEDRVEELENFSMLSSLEKELVDLDVQDAATGLTRFKTGFLVDNFSDPFKVADLGVDTFAVKYEEQTIRPQVFSHEIRYNLQPAQSSNFTVTDDYATLPYTLAALVDQSLSTRVVNLNPYLVVSWVGEIRLTPSADTWIDFEHLPSIINTITNTVTVQRGTNAVLRNETTLRTATVPAIVVPNPIVDEID